MLNPYVFLPWTKHLNYINPEFEHSEMYKHSDATNVVEYTLTWSQSSPVCSSDLKHHCSRFLQLLFPLYLLPFLLLATKMSLDCISSSSLSHQLSFPSYLQLSATAFKLLHLSVSVLVQSLGFYLFLTAACFCFLCLVLM